MFLKVLEVGKSALFLTSVVLDGNFSSPLLRWSYKKNVIWLAKKKKKKRRILNNLTKTNVTGVITTKSNWTQIFWNGSQLPVLSRDVECFSYHRMVSLAVNIISPRNTLVDKETLVNLWSAIPCNVIIACFMMNYLLNLNYQTYKTFIINKSYAMVHGLRRPPGGLP